MTIPLLQQIYPNCADWTAVEKDDYVDIDQQAACLTGYNQRYQQLSAGRYRGWFQTVLLGPQIGLYFETFNQILDQSGACPVDCYAFVFLLEEPEHCQLKSQSFDVNSIMCLPPGAGFDFISGPETRFCVINVAKGAFELFLKGELPEEQWDGGSAVSTAVIRERLDAQILRNMTSKAVQLACYFTGTPSEKIALGGFQISLVSMLASIVSRLPASQQSSIDTRLDLDAKLAFAARDCVHSTEATGLTVTNLANQLGVSRRKLEYAFRTQFDTGPADYIRIIRLNRIRSALLDDANNSLSIGDIASKHGIWHWSRMAQYYRSQFGELPSETRKLNSRTCTPMAHR